MPDNHTNNKAIAKNTIYLYIRMLLTMIVQLYTSRIVLNVLGVEDYGIYNIVGGIVVLFSFINNSLASVTQRFLNFELGRGEIEQTQRVFSMALSIHIGVSIVVILLAETIGLWFLNTQMNIPVERIAAANWVYQFSILTICVSFVQVPYYASVVAYERMSYFAGIAIVEVILKLLIVFLLVYIGFDKLKLYSILTFSVSVVILACYKYYCNNHIAISKYKFFWNKNMFIQLLGFSGWMLLGAAAGIGGTQGVNILLNIFYGVTVNAAIGISNQVNAAVNQFVSNFQTAFMPQIIKLFAAGDKNQLYKLIERSSRFSFLLLFALASPLMLNMDFILHVWLKNVPEYASSFCILILIYSLVEAISKPVGFVIHATGKVKYYNIVMSVALSMNIVFSFLFLKWGFTPKVVLVIYILVGILCFIIRVLLAQYYKALNASSFFHNAVLRCVAVALVVLPVPWYVSTCFTKWQALFTTLVIFIPMYIIASCRLGLTKSERIRLVNFILTKLSKFKNNIW